MLIFPIGKRSTQNVGFLVSMTCNISSKIFVKIPLAAWLLTLLFPLIASSSETLISQAALDQIKNRARAADVGTSREWLLASHYKNRLLGGYKSEIDGRSYFLSPSGKTNPEAELDATLQAFAQPLTANNDEHPQCRYIGRRNFLFKRLAITEIPKLDCPSHMKWKKELDVVGASVIFASAYFGNPASMFGHTFLKLQSRKNTADKDLLNYGVSFAANTGSDGGVPFAVLGLTGGYKAGYTLLPYHQTLREYTNLEGRDVYEYSLNLSPEELDQMLDHLLEVQNTDFDYYFLDENCSYQLLSLLEVARPSLSLTDKFVYFVIPADTVRWVMHSQGLVSQIKYRPSLATELNASTENLGSYQKTLVRELVEKDAPPIQLADLSINEQAQVYDGALRYVSLLAYEKPAIWKERTFKLETQRASLGVIAAHSGATAPPRPEKGHDSSQAGLGFGVREKNEFLEIHGRAAYHHLLSDDTGYLPNSHLEIFRFSVRNYFDADKFLFQELMIADIIALSPWSTYFKPWSWRASVGLTRLHDQPFDSSLAFTVNGGIGNAIAFDYNQNFVWFSFVQLHSDAGGDIEKNARTGASVQTQILIKPLKWLRATAGVEYRNYFVGGESDFTRAWGEASISFTRNLELRGGYTRTHHEDEAKALFLQHFLF